MPVLKLREAMEYSDILRLSTRITAVTVKDGEVIEAKTGFEENLSCRAFVNGAWAYKTVPPEADERVLEEELLEEAKRLSVRVEPFELAAARFGKNFTTKHSVLPSDVPLEKKITALLAIDKEARLLPVHTQLHYVDIEQESRLTAGGSEVEQKLVKCGVALNCVAREGALLQHMFSSHRQSGGWEVMEKLPASFASDCARRAVGLLSAKSPPAGRHMVVLDPLLVGVFTHEAVGHMAEGDFTANQDTVLEGKLGQQIASPLVTIVDDKTIPTAFGSFGIDRDGTAAEKTVLIENGRLVGLMNSRTSGGKLGQRSTGNCRGEFNAVRMSNTVMEPGATRPEELIKETKDGIYLIGSGGGTASTVSGLFNFAALEGYVIKNGELTEHLRDVALLGNTLETLKAIDSVGSNFGLGSGTCGKSGEAVPVGDGGPTIRTTALVGGTS